MPPIIELVRNVNPQIDTVVIADKKFSRLGKHNLDKHIQSYVIDKLDPKDERDYIPVNLYKRLVFVTRYPKNDSNSEREKFRIIGSRIHSQLKAAGIRKVQIDATDSSAWGLLVAEGIALAAYDFDKYITEKKKSKKKIESIQLIGKFTQKEIDLLNNTIEGTYITRTLVNEPVSYLTATQLSMETRKLANSAGFKFEYFNKKKIESLKMGGILGVNKGSKEPPTFNILEWKPAKAQNKHPLIFIGKGVVYDTGGTSLKSNAGMEKMKGDMAGAAAVIGALYAIAKSKLPYHVIGLIPATDNRLDNEAIVPGDVLHMYNGMTVEVLNTDAEGRLILADALHYASKYKPELVIDLATLTGAAVVTVGELGIIAMEKDAAKHYHTLEQAGDAVYERLVRLPLWEEYDDFIKSSVADMKNVGGPYAGSITAGKFLERFVKFPWIHLDLASALIDKTSHYRTVGGSGAGARLLVEFVKHRLK